MTMLSTYHDDSMVTKNRRSQAAQGRVEDILKPKVVEDYNKNMGGVDKSKWLLQFLHDSLIVFWKSFGSILVYSHVPASGFHCHSTCILLTGDQLILYYGFSHRSVKWWKRAFFHLFDLALVNSHILFQVATSSKMTQLEFRTSVATSLLEGLERPRRRHHATATELPVRLTERAFPEPIPEGKKRQDCKVCSVRGAGQRHQTGYRCKLCHTPLCLYSCFERYHTLKDYKIKY